MTTITGTDGSNILIGTNSSDVINANGGNDIVLAGGGNDTVNGGSGSDVLSGGSGNDTVSGGSGNDLISGDSGNDTLDGGTGSDMLLGGSGNDTLIYNVAENVAAYDIYGGGQGQDTLRLVVTQAVYSSAAFQADLAQLQTKLASGSATYNFQSIDLLVTSIEQLEVIVEGGTNQAPTDIALAGNTVAENAAGAVVGTLSTVDPDAGDSHTYTVSDGRFEVVGNSLKLKDGVSLDFESEPSINVSVTATDGGGLSFTESFTVNVGNANEAPTDIALAGNTVAENAAGAVVGTLSTVDPDAGDSHTYTVSDGRFEVVGNSLKLMDGVSLDFESEPSINVSVTATDGGGLSFTESFTVNVGNANEAPTDIALAGNTVAENAAGAVVGTLSTVDPDAGDSHTYTVSDGRFEVVGNSLKLMDGVSLDFESEPSINVSVTATDGGGLSFTESFTVNVGNANEAPTDIALAGNTVAENAAGAVVGTLSTVDPDAGDSHTYTVSDGRFEVVGNSLKLMDGVSLDFEGEPSIDIQVTSTDAGGLAHSETVTIEVTDTNDAPTGISLLGSAVNENSPGAVIGTLSGNDADAGDVLTFSIADANSPFEVVGNTLKLKDGLALDFEDESEVLVTVTVTDSSGATFDRGFTIAVNDGFESLAIDGYISGATVFADANDNGVLDGGEVSATTDGFGNFTLFGGSGPLVMFGGIDISTNQVFEGVMRAPEGSTVVTPLTTLVVAIAEATGVSIATANSQLLEGLGLSADIDLATFDPIAATLSSDPTSQAQGEAAMAAAVQIQNTIVQAASLLEGAGGSFADAAAAVVAELAVQINTQADNDLTIDLNSSGVIQSVITEAATNTAGADAQAVADTATGAANVIASSNNVIEDAVASGQDGTDLLTTLAQVSVVAQGEAATALSGAGAGTTDIGTVESSFTGINLTNAVDDAPVGDVVGVNGDDTITGTANSDTLEGFGGNDTLIGLGGHDLLDGGDGNDSLDGGTGRDRATYAAATGGVTIDLAAGTVSGAGIGTDTLQSVEVIRGSEFADIFNATGFGATSINAGSEGSFNSFEGRGGDDIITGNGNTSVSYRNATGAVTVDLAAGTAVGDASVGSDIIVGGVSNVNASAFDDLLSGNSGNNLFVGNAGNDDIDGRGGLDRAVYASLTEDTVTGGVSIDLAAGTVTGDASVGTDTLHSVEFIRGSNFADTYNAAGFSGTSTNAGSNGTFNEIEGMAGNDTITGNGNTRIAFYNATGAVTVDLAAGTAAGDSSVGTDTIIGGVNSVVGSQFGDTFYGSNNAPQTSEQFEGRAGDDFIDGRGGFDRAIYGNDTAVTSGIAVNLAAGTVTGDGAVGTDTLRSVEGVRGTNFADTYDATGFSTSSINAGSGSNFNEFEGLGGADTITGNGNTRISYSSATGGVTVNFSTHTATGDGSVGADAFSGVFSVQGSNFDDTYVFGSGDGSYVITNFVAGAGSPDKIDLTGVAGIYSLADVLAVATQNGANTGINFGADAITLQNVTLGNLHADDFIFANPAPTDMQLSAVTVGENSANGTVVGALSVTDPGDTATFSLTDDAGGRFAINGNDLVVAGSLDFETATSHSVTVRVTDSANNTHDETFTINVADVNESPAVSLANTVTSIDENVAVGGGIKVADIVVTDDALGTETLTLSGADAASFAIVGNELYYVGASPDFEAQSSYSVTVNADDETLGVPGSVETSQTFTLTVNDVNEAPTAVSFANTTPAIDENVAVGAGIKVADIVVTDDALGTETLTLTGADAASFAIVGNELHYIGASPDFEAQSSYSVTVNADDETLGVPGSVETSQTFVLNINDIAGLTVTGDANNNTLTGSLEIDTIEGLAGNDRLIGGGAADVLDGGDGTDVASYQNAAAGLTADLLTPSNNTGDAAGDSYISIEGLAGTAFNDTLRGDAGNNALEGGAGADSLDGGAGGDTASYQNAAVGVLADLGNSANNTGEAAGDVYVSIENLRGSAHDDTLVGNNSNNLLRGGVGADVLDGSGGNDVADYFNATTALVVDLSNTANNTGEAVGDSYISIEGIRASNAAFDDTLRGDAGNNSLEGMDGADILDGGVGTDLASYNSATAAVIASLATPGANTGAAAGDTYISIEGLIGTAFADNLTGDGANNFLRGGLGSDVLDGGSGSDFADYIGSSAGLTVNLANAALNSGEAAGDTFTSIENIRGSNFNDTLVGDGANNFLRGGLGADALDGGLGGDFADYIGSSGAVTVNLGNSALNTGEAAGDSFTSIESIRGSDFGDTLTGNGGNNFLRGGLGADALDGGNGTDTADYVGSAAGLTVSLAIPASNTGEASGDTFTSIESLRGSNFGDTLIGNGSANTLDGQSGDDRLEGGGGADFLTGGAGNDTFVFASGSAAGATATDFTGNGALAGDVLEFHGFGTAGDGATFTFISGTQWQIHSGLDGHDEIINVTGAVDSLDYLFLA